jgi:hypothetical protein
MGQNLDLGTWVIVRRDCPIAYWVNDELVEFRFGSRQDGVDVVFEPDALRAFVAVAQEVVGGLTRA